MSKEVTTLVLYNGIYYCWLVNERFKGYQDTSAQTFWATFLETWDHLPGVYLCMYTSKNNDTDHQLNVTIDYTLI